MRSIAITNLFNHSLLLFVRPEVTLVVYMGRINVSCGLNFCTINITGKQIVFLRMILILYSHLFIGANLGAIHLFVRCHCVLDEGWSATCQGWVFSLCYVCILSIIWLDVTGHWPWKQINTFYNFIIRKLPITMDSAVLSEHLFCFNTTWINL